MIKKVKLFSNDNPASINAKNLIEEKLVKRGFIISKDNYDLGIAIGGDGSFLRMIKETNFNSNIYYVGINTGTLGFLQEVKVDELDNFITELETTKYKVEEIGIQETQINHNNQSSNFYSLNEIVVRDRNLGIVKFDISIDDDLLESFIGDGILVATSTGSTAHNLSYGGSIVYNTFSCLQITPIGPINSKVYKSLINSVIIPDQRKIKIVPHDNVQDLIVTIDGVNNAYTNVDSITTQIGPKKIKCLRLNRYNFPQKINEKVLNN